MDDDIQTQLRKLADWVRDAQDADTEVKRDIAIDIGDVDYELLRKAADLIDKAKEAGYFALPQPPEETQ